MPRRHIALAVTIALAMLVLGERPGATQLAGAAIAFGLGHRARRGTSAATSRVCPLCRSRTKIPGRPSPVRLVELDQKTTWRPSALTLDRPAYASPAPGWPEDETSTRVIAPPARS